MNDESNAAAAPSVLARFTPTVNVSNIWWVFALWVLYRVLLAAYYVSPLHPLSRFPGPKRAAASYWYEAYHDWWRVGQYTNVIKGMHERYGPIVRINPHELHCADPLFADTIYSTTRPRNKWAHHINHVGTGPLLDTGFSTIPHEQHRARRAEVSRFFSRAQMQRHEGKIADFAIQTVTKLLACAGQPAFDIKEAFNCFTADVISQYAFGEPLGFVAQEGWTPNIAVWTRSFIRSAYMMRHNSLGRNATALLPFVSEYLGEDVRAVGRVMKVHIPRFIAEARKNPANGTVFAEVMGERQVGAREMKRYVGEGMGFLIAGTETTAAVLTVFVFHLLDKPEIHARLLSVLPAASPTQPPKWTTLEKIPYFWAIIHECLRMMPGVSHRSARIAPDEDLHYRSADGTFEYVVPRGTPIGMTSMINHWNEELFPAPDEFKPERWIRDDGTVDWNLQRRLLSFGKGSRSCVGENLAYCEMYLISAMLAVQVLPRAKLVDTTIDDITYDHDLVVVQTKKGSIRVNVEIE